MPNALAQPTAGATDDAGVESPPPNAQPTDGADAPPPPPPPVTVGTPIDGSEKGAAAGGTPAPPPTPPAPPTPPTPPTDAPPTRAVAESGEDAPRRFVVRERGRVGLRYALEGVEVRGNTSTLARVVLRYVPFRTGDALDVDDPELELTRFRLLGTGFFRDVQLSLRRGSRRGYVVLVVHVVERNTIVVSDLWLGLSRDADPSGRARPLTAYGGIDVAETNLAGTGVTLGGAIAVAENQLALRTRFGDPQLFGTRWLVESELLYNKALDFFGNRDVLVDDPSQRLSQDFAVVSYRRFGGRVGAGRDLGVTTRVLFDYRLETIDATLPLAASHRRGIDIEPVDFKVVPGDSVFSTLGATVIVDTRDEPVLPTKGTHLLGGAMFGLGPFGSDYRFTKLEARASRWFALPVHGHVLRLEAMVGAVSGNAPLFERFYVGDLSDLLPDRALGLAFDRRSAPNFFGTNIVETRYGDYAARVNFEYRIPLYRGRRSIYGADFFVATGLYALTTGLELERPSRGYSGIGRIPVDLTFNLGLRADTAAGAFTFGISNFVGFIPVRSDGQ